MASETQNETVQKLVNMLLEFLVKQFGDQDLFKTLQPLVPIMVRLGVEEGIAAAEDLMAGLAGDNNYEHWQTLIRISTPEERLVIMEQGRQSAIRQRLRELERNERLKDAFKIGLNILIGVLGVLLI